MHFEGLQIIEITVSEVPNRKRYAIAYNGTELGDAGTPQYALRLYRQFQVAIDACGAERICRGSSSVTSIFGKRPMRDVTNDLLMECVA